MKQFLLLASALGLFGAQSSISLPRIGVLDYSTRELVIQALKETNNNQVHAAKMLGITRATLRKRIEKFGIMRELNVK